MGELISDHYREQLRTMHGGGVWGDGGEKWGTKILKRVATFQRATVLDYGAGGGSLRRFLSGAADVREYDPAVPGKDVLPEPADIVACIDVLEHIEPDRLQEVLQHIYDLTKSMAFFVIATRPAEKRLPDGRNAHLIIDNAPWWCDQLRQFKWGFNSVVVNRQDELTLWASKV